MRGAQYIGRIVIVEEAIRNGRGKVRVGDTIWAAEGEDAATGAKVEVTGVNGTVLVVVNSGRGIARVTLLRRRRGGAGRGRE